MKHRPNKLEAAAITLLRTLKEAQSCSRWNLESQVQAAAEALDQQLFEVGCVAFPKTQKYRMTIRAWASFTVHAQTEDEAIAHAVKVAAAAPNIDQPIGLEDGFIAIDTESVPFIEEVDDEEVTGL